MVIRDVLDGLNVEDCTDGSVGDDLAYCRIKGRVAQHVADGHFVVVLARGIN